MTYALKFLKHLLDYRVAQRATLDSNDNAPLVKARP